ncbi:ATP-binding cassette sub-family G member 2 [Takifugu flavidus]|uniref:ATP-binding cassette sub-family G member 2 n=1 Tax=Takifugu flavidus TaxID=433684 RepID=A0A5C6PJ97_9TELE|nr:ATP-binding cassette sub-family G member 2 [Takifugu flavidus]
MSDVQMNIELDLNGARKQQPAGSASQQQGATVSFHNIHYEVKEGGCCLWGKRSLTKSILIDLNGIMKPGLNAIMGATGSGKSSFLDILAARKDPAGLMGEVLINGAPQPPNFKCLSGYVVQDDVVMGTLTVRENLNFSAALRLPTYVTQKEKQQKVNKLIEELGLGRVADSRVGTQLIRGISGGERKRTNIGMELIIDPSVLFLDEPTTGLDASTANSVLLLLKRMAKNGRTIILSIHQPRYSIYRLFDSLTLLVNGKQVYHGPAQRALAYFSDIGYTCETHNNPADFFLDIINGDTTAVANSREGCDDWIIKDKDRKRTAPSRTITYNTSFLTQFKWVLKRTFRNLMLNPQTSVAQLLSDILMLRTIPAVVFTCVAYFMIGLKMTAEAFFLFMFTVILVAYTSTSMALAISADQTVVAIANIFMTIACVFMMALLINEYTGLNFCKGVNISEIPPGVICTGEAFLTGQGVDFSAWGFWQNHVALGIMTTCFLTITYLKLRFIQKFT